jgi:tRNA U54 and U55 pseudouridine synthase Pus10
MSNKIDLFETDFELPDHEIIVDFTGSRVWINASDGSSIGRFNKARGIDVHRTATAQMAGEPECLHCTHEPAGKPEWDIFCREIKTHYGIVVPEDLISFDDGCAVKNKSRSSKPR